MIELLRDPLWQFVGAIIGMLALVATVAIYLYQRRRKALSFEIASSSSLLSLKEEIEGKIRILYEDIPVRKVHLIVIRIYNSGNAPIEAADFERELSFSFGDGSRIISHEVTEATPDTLQVSYAVINGTIRFEPCLLNGKDSFSVKILVSDYQGHLDVDARISGVSDVKEESPRYSTSIAISTLGVAMTIGGLIYAFSNRNPDTQPLFASTEEAIGFAIFVAGYLIMGAGMLINRRMRKRFLATFRRALSL